jgi:hypothetical protein
LETTLHLPQNGVFMIRLLPPKLNPKTYRHRAAAK